MHSERWLSHIRLHPREKRFNQRHSISLNHFPRGISLYNWLYKLKSRIVIIHWGYAHLSISRLYSCVYYLSLCYIQVYISLREYLTFIISLTVRINIAEGIINIIAGTIIIIHQVSWLDSCTTFYNYFSMQMRDYNIHLHISPLMTHTKQLPHLTTTALLLHNRKS